MIQADIQDCGVSTAVLKDMDGARRLWEVSERLVGVRFTA